MKTDIRRTTSLLGIGMVALLGLSACGGDAEEPAAESDQEMTEETEGTEAEATEEEPMDEESMEEEEPMEEESMDESDPAANLVGASCEAYAEEVPEGDGSVGGMAEDPVATAASNNPMLTTLTAAVSGELNPDVDLVDTLNGDEFTVIAPTDDAFAAIPEEDLNAVVEDADMLTEVLTYHVIPGQMSPDEIAGEHETVNGATVTIEGEGDDLTFDDAGLVCGGVMTENATVYMVDAVLMPAAAQE